MHGPQPGTPMTAPASASVCRYPSLIASCKTSEEAGDLSKLLGAWRVRTGSPPMILFFGSQDKWLEGGREVARQSAAMGNRAELYIAPGVGHGFFNDSRRAKNGVPGWHDAVLAQTDLFLSSLGFLTGQPTARAPEGIALRRESLKD